MKQMENENITTVVEEPAINDPVVPQVPPVPEKKSNLFKILVVLIGIVISLGLFANAYLMFSKNETVSKTSDSSVIVTPTPDLYTEQSRSATADWKTYSDTEFSFKYPSDWNVKEMKSNDLAWLKTTSKYLGFGPATVGEDVLGSIRVTSDSLTQVVSDTKSQRLPTGTPSRLVTEEKTVFNGYDATLLVFENTLAKVMDTSYLISRNNKTYIIIGGGTKDTTIIDQILSTFKFTP